MNRKEIINYSNMTNKEIVDLFHRLGRDAELTQWDQSDDSVLVYRDFWEAFSDLLKVLGMKVKCPLYEEERYNERVN